MATKLSSLDFVLPPKLIASYPKENREEARLMVIDRKEGKIEHKVFADIVNYFSSGDVIIINNTRVLPAMLYGSKDKTGAKIEVILLRCLGDNLWDTLVEPARKIRVGNKLYFAENALVAEVLDNTTSRGRTLKFLFEGTKEDFYKVIEQIGMVPLPNQIKRKPEDQDKERYQTIYAEHIGAVVAPAAGFHFTPHLIKELYIKNVAIPPITLHNSLSTLSPIDVEDLTKHKVGSEYFNIPASTAQTVNQALEKGSRICAVGTTTLKAIESAVSVAGRLVPKESWTNKFIFPPYDFKIPNALLTNFHLPGSTPLANVAAFAGTALIKTIYETAIKEKYRFFVYGDAMLIV